LLGLAKNFSLARDILDNPRFQCNARIRRHLLPQRYRSVAIDVLGTEGVLSIFYKTNVSLSDCKGIQAEVRALWMQVLRGDADKRHARRVFVSPEDSSLRSQSFTYGPDQGN
jgi:hypothetical protein